MPTIYELAEVYWHGTDDVGATYHALVKRAREVVEDIDRWEDGALPEPPAECKEDLFRILRLYPSTAAPFRDALMNGRVDGATYIFYSGCGCLWAWIGRLKYGTNGWDKHLVGRTGTPTAFEKFLQDVRPGETPATSRRSALALAWTEEFLAMSAPTSTDP